MRLQETSSFIIKENDATAVLNPYYTLLLSRVQADIKAVRWRCVCWSWIRAGNVPRFDLCPVPGFVYQLCLHKFTKDRQIKNTQLSPAHPQYWPANTHHISSTKEPKAESRAEEKKKSNPSQQFTNKVGLLKTEQSNVHQHCSSPVDPVQYVHMCKGIQQIKGWNL